MSSEKINPKVGDNPKQNENTSFKGYRQVYVIKHKKEGQPQDLREVFFQCGNWCYEGTLPLEFLRLVDDMSISDIPKVAPALQKRQDDLSFVCLSSNLMAGSESFASAVKIIDEANSFLAQELTSSMVTSNLEDHRKDIENFEDTYYFELKGVIPSDMDNIQCICAKTYRNNGLCLVTIYFEAVFYCIISNTSEDEPLLDIQFPDVSQEGDGITLGIYDGRDNDDSNFQWRKLSLWKSTPVKHEWTHISTTSNIISLSSDIYMQTYCILKPNKLDPSDRDVLFRFGSWCYTGNVELIESLRIEDISHIIPALRIQQHNLAYLCDVSSIPKENIFSEPLMHNTHIIKELEDEIISMEGTIQSITERSPNNWLDQNPNKLFFEFSSTTANSSVFENNHIDLIATKSYRPNGLIVMTIYFNGSYYLCVNNSDDDQPLLDSKFPCLVQEKGYQLKTYSSGLDSFPELRKLTIWQQFEGNEKSHLKVSPIKVEVKTRESESKTFQQETSNKVERVSQNENCDNVSINQQEHDNKKKWVGSTNQLYQNPEMINLEQTNSAEEKKVKTSRKQNEIRHSRVISFNTHGKIDSTNRTNLGAFHHLAPLRKPSALAEQIKKIHVRDPEHWRIPYNTKGQPLC